MFQNSESNPERESFEEHSPLLWWFYVAKGDFDEKRHIRSTRKWTKSRIW